MKRPVKIVGMTVENAIAKLGGLSPYWGRKLGTLELSETGIETVYDILVEFATAYANNKLTEKKIIEIDWYYKKWYGYSIRLED